jgi:cobalamin biosynthesis protein CbiG
VVVCDEAGKFSISLLSGHIGGANRLSKAVALILGGEAVITTATDVRGLKAFDELGAEKGWKVENPGKIKILNSMLLEGKKIAVCIPEDVYKKEYAEKPNITYINAPEDVEADGLVVFNSEKLKLDIPVLYLKG